jgi:hypothetical protein
MAPRKEWSPLPGEVLGLRRCLRAEEELEVKCGVGKAGNRSLFYRPPQKYYAISPKS